jgi:flagellar hook-basal body complex protein FliE
MTLNSIGNVAGAMAPAGDVVKMNRTRKAHLDLDGNSASAAEAAGEAGAPSFQNALIRAMDGVNAKQMSSTEITERMLTDPDSVDAHDVTVAQAEANLSLNIARSVIDRLVRGWKEIINSR